MILKRQVSRQAMTAGTAIAVVSLLSAPSAQAAGLYSTFDFTQSPRQPGSSLFTFIQDGLELRVTGTQTPRSGGSPVVATVSQGYAGLGIQAPHRCHPDPNTASHPLEANCTVETLKLAFFSVATGQPQAVKLKSMVTAESQDDEVFDFFASNGAAYPDQPFSAAPSFNSTTHGAFPSAFASLPSVKWVDLPDEAATTFELAASQSGSSFYLTGLQAETQAVPTPALLPGLIGFGMSLLRKRKRVIATADPA